MSSDISRDDWLKALDEAVNVTGQLDDSALTVLEFAKMCNIPEGTARNRLKLMVKAGKAIQTRKRSHTSILAVTAYRLVPSKGER
jgi:hypothetical protein